MASSQCPGFSSLRNVYVAMALGEEMPGPIPAYAMRNSWKTWERTNNGLSENVCEHANNSTAYTLHHFEGNFTHNKLPHLVADWMKLSRMVRHSSGYLVPTASNKE